MSIEPTDRRRKSPSVIPRITKNSSRKVARPSFPAKNDSPVDQRIVDKVKLYDFVREDKISEVKVKVLHRSYESSHFLDNLAEKILKELS